MADYREHFTTRPDLHYRERKEAGYAGPLIALAVIAVLIGSVFFLSSGVDNADIAPDAAAPAATAPAPAAQ